MFVSKTPFSVLGCEMNALLMKIVYVINDGCFCFIILLWICLIIYTQVKETQKTPYNYFPTLPVKMSTIQTVGRHGWANIVQALIIPKTGFLLYKLSDGCLTYPERFCFLFGMQRFFFFVQYIIYQGTLAPKHNHVWHHGRERTSSIVKWLISYTAYEWLGSDYLERPRTHTEVWMSLSTLLSGRRQLCDQTPLNTPAISGRLWEKKGKPDQQFVWKLLKKLTNYKLIQKHQT